MTRRRYPPFARMPRSGQWQCDHVFVLVGLGAYDRAQRLYNIGQCLPAISIPESVDPSLYKWPVRGMDVTVKNYGTTTEFAECLIFELLMAGAKLVVHVTVEAGALDSQARGMSRCRLGRRSPTCMKSEYHKKASMPLSK